MTNFREKLKFQADNSSLGVKTAEWQVVLDTVVPDAVAGIRHAAVKGNAEHRLHVAAIPEKVNCHVHFHGEEGYGVVAGTGRLHWGQVTISADNTPSIKWEKPVDVKAGESFIIPEGYAHQLQKTGNSDLVIVFGCPDTHLDNTQDRLMLADAPTLKPAEKLQPKIKP